MYQKDLIVLYRYKAFCYHVTVL
ncbi:hypothetical protein Avbf_14389 [Armadillidium vulgare]|nr:hypothetical protein Avbf_14389 [Armadillidium vulgare]